MTKAEALERIVAIAESVLDPVPTIRWHEHCWEFLVSGEVPCNCDSFEDAAEEMRKWLSKPARRKKYDRFAKASL